MRQFIYKYRFIYLLILPYVLKQFKILHFKNTVKFVLFVEQVHINP